MMDETLERLEAERQTWRQILKQTGEIISLYEDGWMSDDSYAEAVALRDRCYEEIDRLNAEIAEMQGEEPPEPLEKVGYAMPERMAGTEDAMADLSEVTSETVITAQDNADAIAELSEIVSELVPRS